MKRRVVALGLCVVDHLYRVESIDLHAPRTRWLERLEAPGGMACNAALQAAALGCPVELLSAVGDDRDGRSLRRELRERRVGVRGVIRLPGRESMVAMVLVAARGGERKFVVPDRRAFERAAPDFDLGVVASRGVLLVDGHFPRQALAAAKRARQVGASVVGDFSRPGPGVDRLLPWVDFPIVPEEFALATGDGDVRRALRRLRERCGGAPVVTQGERGGLFLRDGRVRRYRARRTRVYDTTGAGDVFHGAFAAGLFHGEGFEACLALAARAAARSCRRLGANADLLGIAEVASLRRRVS